MDKAHEDGAFYLWWSLLSLLVKQNIITIITKNRIYCTCMKSCLSRESVQNCLRNMSTLNSMFLLEIPLTLSSNTSNPTFTSSPSVIDKNNYIEWNNINSTPIYMIDHVNFWPPSPRGPTKKFRINYGFLLTKTVNE